MVTNDLKSLWWRPNLENLLFLWRRFGKSTDLFLTEQKWSRIKMFFSNLKWGNGIFTYNLPLESPIDVGNYINLPVPWMVWRWVLGRELFLVSFSSRNFMSSQLWFLFFLKILVGWVIFRGSVINHPWLSEIIASPTIWESCIMDLDVIFFFCPGSCHM